MRTILPVEPNKKSFPGISTKKPSESVLNLSVPIRLVKERFFIRLIVDKDLSFGDHKKELTISQRIINSSVLFLIIFLMLLVILSGIFFIGYLVKSAMGIDIFPVEHVLSSLIWGMV